MARKTLKGRVKEFATKKARQTQPTPVRKPYRGHGSHIRKIKGRMRHDQMSTTLIMPRAARRRTIINALTDVKSDFGLKKDLVDIIHVWAEQQMLEITANATRLVTMRCKQKTGERFGTKMLGCHFIQALNMHFQYRCPEALEHFARINKDFEKGFLTSGIENRATYLKLLEEAEQKKQEEEQ